MFMNMGMGDFQRRENNRRIITKAALDEISMERNTNLFSLHQKRWSTAY